MFDPALFAEIAEELPALQKWDKVARIRTSVGRSYYALFSALRVAVRTAQGKPADTAIDPHGKLVNALYSAESDVKKGEHAALAQTLQELMDARRQADYFLEPAEPWRSKLEKVTAAEHLARIARSALKQIPTIDFKPVGRHLV